MKNFNYFLHGSILLASMEISLVRPWLNYVVVVVVKTEYMVKTGKTRTVTLLKLKSRNQLNFYKPASFSMSMGSVMLIL